MSRDIGNIANLQRSGVSDRFTIGCAGEWVHSTIVMRADWSNLGEIPSSSISRTIQTGMRLRGRPPSSRHISRGWWDDADPLQALLAAVDCNLQRRADLSHAGIRETTQPLDEHGDRNALDRVEVDR